MAQNLTQGNAPIPTPSPPETQKICKNSPRPQNQSNFQENPPQGKPSPRALTLVTFPRPSAHSRNRRIRRFQGRGAKKSGFATVVRGLANLVCRSGSAAFREARASRAPRGGTNDTYAPRDLSASPFFPVISRKPKRALRGSARKSALLLSRGGIASRG